MIKETSTEQLEPFTDEAFNAVTKVLQTIGLNTKYGWSMHAQNPDSYFSGSMEWSERGFGARFYLYTGTNGRVNRIHCTNLYSHYKAVPQDKLDEVNQELKNILIMLNQ